MWNLVHWFWSGIKLRPPALGAQVLATGPPGKSHLHVILICISLMTYDMKHLFICFFCFLYISFGGFPGVSVGKESASNGDRLQCRRPGFDPWVREILWRKKSQPTPYFCLGNHMDRGSWWATVHGVTRVGHDLVTKPPPAPYFLDERSVHVFCLFF